MSLDALPSEIMEIIFSYLSSIDIIKLLSLNKNCLKISNGITQLNISQLIRFSLENKQVDFYQKRKTLKQALRFIATRFPNLETIIVDHYLEHFYYLKSYTKNKTEKDKKYEIFDFFLNNLKYIKHLYFHYSNDHFGPNLAFHYRNQLESLALPVDFFLDSDGVYSFCKEDFPNLRKLFVEYHGGPSSYAPFTFYDKERNLTILNFLSKIINQLSHLKFDFLFEIFQKKEEFDKLFTKENKLISLETMLLSFIIYQPNEHIGALENTFENLFKLKRLTFKYAPQAVCKQITEFNLPYLEYLDLSNSYNFNVISHTKLKQLILKEMNSDQLILNCPNLEILNINESIKLNNLQFQSIHNNLYNIDFCKCKLLTDSCFQNIAENCPSITNLDFAFCNINNTFNFSNLKKLQKLNCIAPEEFDKYILINIFNTCPLLSNVTICGLTILVDEMNEILKREENNFIEWNKLKELNFLNGNLNSNFISLVLNKSKNIEKLKLFNVKSNDNLFTVTVRNDSLKLLNLHSLPELTSDSLNEIINNLPNLENLSICHCSSVKKIINLGKKLKILELTLDSIDLSVESESLQELILKYVNEFNLENNFKFTNLQTLRFFKCNCLISSSFHFIMKTDSLINLHIDSCDKLLEFKIPNQINFLEIINCKGLKTIILQENEIKLQKLNVENCEQLNDKQLKKDLKRNKSSIVIYNKKFKKINDNKNCNIQ